MPQRPLHVVFAPGAIGMLVAARLAASGRRVRVVRRSGDALRIPGVETVRGDVLDRDVVRAAVEDAEVVYQTMRAGLATEWEEHLPRILGNAIDAAGRAGSRLVVLDDLTAYGRPEGRPFSEATPPAPCSRAGEVRARIFEDLASAACRGDLRAVVGRTSSLFGPAVWACSPLGERFLRAAVADQPAALPGDPGVLHSYGFSSDVAAALVVLGIDPASDGLWMLPSAPAVSTLTLVRYMATALGRTIRLRPPAGHPRAVDPPGVAGQDELSYRWEQPYVVDDSRFRARYGDLSTSLEHAARQTVDDAVARLGAGRSSSASESVAG